MERIKNAFSYLFTAYSDFKETHFKGLVELTLYFDHELNKAVTPYKLGIKADYLKDSVFDDSEAVAILKSTSYFDISIDEPKNLNAKSIYPLFQHSVLCLNQHMTEEYNRLQIPFQQAECPLFDNMKDQLDLLVIDLLK